MIPASARTLGGTALLFAAGFLVCHLIGFRDDVSVLSGTMPASGGQAAMLGGVLYVLSWLLTVVAAPILMLAAVLLTVFRRRAPADPSRDARAADHASAPASS